MAKKRLQMAQKSWRIEEIFPRFVNAQMAKGVSDKTVLTYNRHFHSLGYHRASAFGWSACHAWQQPSLPSLCQLFELFSCRQHRQPFADTSFLKFHFQSVDYPRL